MKHLFAIFLTLLIFSCTKPINQELVQDMNYTIIPQPTSLKKGSGMFILNSQTSISADSNLTDEVAYLTEMINSALEGTIKSNTVDKAEIVLSLDPQIENVEGYILNVTSDQISIRGKSAQGVFYGIQSLRQLMPAAIETASGKENEIYIHAVSIEDSPRYIYRGMHLDVGRHFFPADFVKKYIDLLAMHKMNTFHWHLTEDQGWRIEIKKYPKLTEIGAWRKETLVGHYDEKDENPAFDGKKHGGFYTQEEIKDIVAYATKRHITIIPEIDLPGHSLAVLAAYPELGNTGKQYEVGTRWGIYDQVYAPSEKTFAFLEDVFTEIIALFPGKRIHIGADEAKKIEWEQSALAQSIIKKEGLKDENGLQSYFIKRIEKFLNEHDRTIIAWDEALEGGVESSTSIMFWRSWLGTEEVVKAAEEKHDIIMTPASHMYFDHYQVPEERRSEEPLAIGGFTSIEKVYQFEPTPEGISPEAEKHIIGAQANVWTEYMKTSDYIEYMVLPRMTALSEVVWSPKVTRNWEDFQARLKHFSKRLDAMGVNYAKHSFEGGSEKVEGRKPI